MIIALSLEISLNYIFIMSPDVMRRLLFQQYGKHQLLLLIADIFIIAICLSLALMSNYLIKDYSMTWNNSKVFLVFTLLSTLCLLFFYMTGLYDLLHMRRREALIISLIVSLTAVILIYSSISYFIIMFRPGKFTLLIFAGLTIISTFIWRSLCKTYLLIEPQKILVIGKDRVIDELNKIITEEYPHHYTIMGHWHDQETSPGYSELLNLAQERGINLIIYSVQSRLVKKVAHPLLNLRFQNIIVYDAPTFYQRLTGKFPIWHLDDFWMLINSQKEAFFPTLTANIKRAFDIFFSIFCLPFALPLIIICFLAIKLSSRGPVFFIQERLGQYGVPFRLVKLRTMYENAEEQSGPVWSSEFDPRITPVGRILRKLRLDELPQLFNLLKGEMSVIGPRPIRKHFADLLTAEIPYYQLRFLVKPGLTGWAQVNRDYGGSKEGQAEKLQYELFYLVNQSIWLDIFILLKTLKIMIWGKGT
jgi:exopolysaccharide biosynthesis polyprenyl glycosylphosphotransferase